MSKPGLLGQIDAIGADAFHILLVEDDELTLKVTEGLLRHCNYQGVNSTALDPAEQACCALDLTCCLDLQSHWPEMVGKRWRLCSRPRGSILTSF